MKLLAGSANPTLAKKIATGLGIEQLAVESQHFANGGRRVHITSKARGENIILVQSFSEPTDQHIIETLLLIDALERMGARHINLVIPWMGYSFQDKVFREGEPIAAKVIANVLSNTYTKRAFLLDLHNPSIPGFFSLPTHHLSALGMFVEHAKKNVNLKNAVVASPDFGGLKRARSFAQELDLPLINIDKHRDLNSGQVTAVGLHGDASGKTILLFDDSILSGGTVAEAAKLLKEQGAQQVIFFATHGLLVGNGREKLQQSAVDQVVITNSVHQADLPTKIVQLDCSAIFVEELRDWMRP